MADVKYLLKNDLVDIRKYYPQGYKYLLSKKPLRICIVNAFDVKLFLKDGGEYIYSQADIILFNQIWQG